MASLAGLKAIARGDTHYDFVGKARRWFIISGIVLLLSLIGLFVRHLNLGLAFKGGSSFSVPIAANIHPTVRTVTDEVKAAGIPDAEVQLIQPKPGSGGLSTLLVQARHVAGGIERQAQVKEALAKAAGQFTSVDGNQTPNVELVNVQDVGPKWGREISNKALRGLIAFLILVVIYISFRFELKMAGAAMVALLHDLIATVGIYALIGFEVSPATVVAYLTILGYSLYDTVVVFDKVRENTENLTSASKTTYSEMVNRSTNQVLMRSINTSLTSLLPVGALLFVGAFLLGAETLKDLALAMFIGIAVGAYSSIFIASPVLAIWKEREPRYKQLAARLRQAGVRPAAATAMAGGGGTADAAAVEREPVRTGGGQRPKQVRGRSKRRGKRRR